MTMLLLTTWLVSGAFDVQPLSQTEKARMISVSEMLARAEVRFLGKTRRLAPAGELIGHPGTVDLFRSRRQEPLLAELRATNGASSREYLIEIELLQKPKQQPRFWVLLIHRRTGDAIRTRHDGAMFEGSVKRNAAGEWDPTTFREREKL